MLEEAALFRGGKTASGLSTVEMANGKQLTRRIVTQGDQTSKQGCPLVFGRLRFRLFPVWFVRFDRMRSLLCLESVANQIVQRRCGRQKVERLLLLLLGNQVGQHELLLLILLLLLHQNGRRIELIQGTQQS